ncbi:hypothetical protein [Pectobacterium aroidearum]|uniref:hypothetical protein n=1 Tax=Pectobacterium aroidearum TaxID=1201031 RepID=UPI002115243E|nr:hypothetical protein [Pectobacterium aroidearum]UUE46504.1 hypothetical protein L0Y28_07725 [Pectobacterium aroidearum]UUE50725.1 hypothetical protein L0Y23_07735 [Pectobacterium aroidearum]UUE54930.1 hypothetical protein L0Y30_07735 [Pectobacterium aroidearum]UUE63338.1 hypothetical protein L0Y29_07725 [Pectobacterium aroidearum]UUE67563.1 hypothetical protein L0Y22_07725 [Pectobacterium aroidearum]
MTTILHPNYVVVSKLISKFDITHDSRDENINILISVIYDLDNGNTIEYYINNQEEAEKKCIEKTDFQENLIIALIIYHLKKPARLKIITNPNKKFELRMELMSIPYNVLILCTGTIKTMMLLLVFFTTNIREIACLML